MYRFCKKRGFVNEIILAITSQEMPPRNKNQPVTLILTFNTCLLLSLQTLQLLVSNPCCFKIVTEKWWQTLCEKCLHSQFFWSVSFRMRTEYGRNISWDSVRKRKNTDQKKVSCSKRHLSSKLRNQEMLQ